MKQFIYLSSFPAAPDTTVKQQIHFAADVAHAVLSGYDYIKSSDNLTFQILDDNELIEVDITEEDLQTGYLNELAQQDDDADYCINCHNLMLIDGILNNTLSSTDNITPDKADTMLKLAQLKHMLIRDPNA